MERDVGGEESSNGERTFLPYLNRKKFREKSREISFFQKKNFHFSKEILFFKGQMVPFCHDLTAYR